MRNSAENKTRFVLHAGEFRTSSVIFGAPNESPAVSNRPEILHRQRIWATHWLPPTAHLSRSVIPINLACPAIRCSCLLRSIGEGHAWSHHPRRKGHRVPPKIFSAIPRQDIQRKTYRLGLFTCDISCFFGHGCYTYACFSAVLCLVGEQSLEFLRIRFVRDIISKNSSSFRSREQNRRTKLIKLTKTMVALTTPGRSMAIAAAILSAAVGAASGEGE